MNQTPKKLLDTPHYYTVSTHYFISDWFSEKTLTVEINIFPFGIEHTHRKLEQETTVDSVGNGIFYTTTKVYEIEYYSASYVFEFDARIAHNFPKDEFEGSTLYTQCLEKASNLYSKEVIDNSNKVLKNLYVSM